MAKLSKSIGDKVYIAIMDLHADGKLDKDDLYCWMMKYDTLPPPPPPPPGGCSCDLSADFPIPILNTWLEYAIPSTKYSHSPRNCENCTTWDDSWGVNPYPADTCFNWMGERQFCRYVLYYKDAETGERKRVDPSNCNGGGLAPYAQYDYFEDGCVVDFSCTAKVAPPTTPTPTPTPTPDPSPSCEPPYVLSNVMVAGPYVDGGFLCEESPKKVCVLPDAPLACAYYNDLLCIPNSGPCDCPIPSSFTLCADEFDEATRAAIFQKANNPETEHPPFPLEVLNFLDKMNTTREDVITGITNCFAGVDIDNIEEKMALDFTIYFENPSKLDKKDYNESDWGWVDDYNKGISERCGSGVYFRVQLFKKF